MNEKPETNPGWRWTRRILVAVACLATLVAVFYAEEDWRGKRAWENCKRELEAKGAVLDWDKYIPPSLPDDQNFYTASTNIALRFVKLSQPSRIDEATRLEWLRLWTQSNSFPVLDFSKPIQPVVADITFVSGNSDSAVNFDDPASHDKIQGLIRTALGRSANGSQGFQFCERALNNLTPVKIDLKSSGAVTVHDLENDIPSDLATNIGRLAVAATVDPNVFRVRLVSGRITPAADYLEWSDQYVPAFDEVREALKRPYAIIPGDYSVPYLIPIPNFVTMRAVAQTLSQRAQCDFLLGRPEDALREVTLMHDVCRILEKPPTGKPITLVEAMINVAIHGLYVSTVADGFRLGAWREPQIVVLQEQFKTINLLSTVHDSFASEQAASTCTIEKTPASKIADLFNMVDVISPDARKPSAWSTAWKRISNPIYLFFRLSPRGWIYQNMVTVASGVRSEDSVDLEIGTISPQFVTKAFQDLEKGWTHRTPFNIWASIAIPNFNKAWQTTAHNQTLVNEGQIVCSLERYQLAHGEYPETLDALVPQFIEKLPHDIIGGQPLHYRRTTEGKFLLYSVGWNETDDGGQESPPNQNGGIDYAKGDWVWQSPQK